MQRWMWALCAVPMALGGCSDQDDSGCAWASGGYAQGDNGAGPGAGVSFDLSGIHDRLEAAAPAAITACFDADCDHLTLVVADGRPQCEGAPGGPPDQLTSCSFDRSGDLRVSIVRIDSRDYSDGAPHTVAIAVLDRGGERVLSYATQVRFTSDEVIALKPY